MNSTISERGHSLLAFSNDLAWAVERASRAVVTVYARRGAPSSGIHWAEGVVVTAAHTIRREEEIGLKLPDGRKIGATLAGVDSGTDLAVLKIETTELPNPELGETSGLKPGHLVLGLGRSGDLKVSLGTVSSLGALGERGVAPKSTNSFRPICHVTRASLAVS
jgi:serine protease Do